jgi:molybdate transport system substrate-binding protein
MEAEVAKLNVMCARSMHRAVEALSRDFTRRTGHDVALDFGTVGALQAKIEAGRSADVMILSVPAIDKLEEAGALVSGSRADVARTFIAVCVREGAPRLDIATPESFERTLRQARTIALSDPGVGGSAGVYLAGLFARMGLTAMIAERGMLQSSGVEVAKRVVEGNAELGLTLSGEVASVRGAVIAGPLPAPLGQDTTYCAAISQASTERAAAMTFIAALTAEATRETWKAAGFELPAARA